MSTVVVATSVADAQALEAVKDHHAQLSGALAAQVEALLDAAVRGDLPAADAASDALVRWCQAELMHELLGSHEPDESAEGVAEDGCGGECGCSEQDPAGVLPVFDARAVPHAIRHATIFGALDSVGAGSGLVLVAPHDPLPLLTQLEERSPGLFSVDYLERGPEAWRLRFIRA